MKIPVIVKGKTDTPEDTLATIDLFLAAKMGRLPLAPKHPRDISNQLNRKFFDVLGNTPRFKCLAPQSPPCQEKPISSHSIQLATTLSFLSDKTGHVIGFKMLPDTERGVPRYLEKLVGINKASTFDGLCAAHDSEVFKDIETEALLRPTPRQLFLLAYRAVLRQLVQDQIDAHRSLKLASEAEEQFLHDDRVKILLRSMASNDRQKLQCSLQMKHEMDKVMRKGNLGKAVRSMYRVVRPVGFTVSAMFTPLRDFEGRQIWGTWNPAVVILSVLPGTEGTLIAVTVPKSSQLKVERLMTQCRSANDERLVRMVWELALCGTENLFISPEAWNKLSGEQKQTTLRFWYDTHYLREVPTPELVVPEI